MFPGIIISPLPSAILMVLLLILFDRFTHENEKSHLLPAVIIDQLTLLVEDLENSDFRDRDVKNNIKVLNERIWKISSLIRKMGSTFNDLNPINRCLIKRFNYASKAFLSLKICVSLPEGSSNKILKRKTESILNIFLSGNFSDLPKAPFVSYEYIKYERRAGIIKNITSMVALGLFLSTPILTWGIVLWVYNPSIAPSIQTLLPILYIIWCVVGILSFSDRLAPEAKDIIKDVFKLVITKK